MVNPGNKCLHCKGYQECPYRDPTNDTCWFEPNDHPGGIGSATAKEVEEQNLFPSSYNK